MTTATATKEDFKDNTEWPAFITGAGPTGRAMAPPMRPGQNPCITVIDNGAHFTVTSEQREKYWGPLMPRVFTQGFVEGYANARNDFETKRMVAQNLASYNILPMPVETSPLIVAVSCDPTKGTKSPCSSSAYSSLHDLFMLLYAVKRFMYDEKKDATIVTQIRMLDALLEKEVGDAGATLEHTLRRHVYEPEFNREITRREATLRFARILEMFTLWMINRFEVFIYEGLVLGFRPATSDAKPIPELACMTPHAEPTGLLWLKADPEGGWWGRANKIASYTFSVRTHGYNQTMVELYAQRGEGEMHTPVDPWRIKDYESATYAAFYEEVQKRREGAQGDSPTLYKQWILYSMLDAYKTFINIAFE